MTSLLGGSLARSVGNALGPILLPATLKRGTSSYPCKAMFDSYGKYSGPAGAIATPDVTILVLAATLVVAPQAGDIVLLQGENFVVFSAKDSVPAVSTDPARAVWKLKGSATPLQGGAYASYAAMAVALGAASFNVYRPGSPWTPPGALLAALPALFTNAKASGFSFTKSIGYEDILWHGLFDGSQTQVGDILKGLRTYFIAAQEPLLPIMCVLCNRTVTITRPGSELSSSGGQGQGLPSQAGGTGRYWGPSQTPATSGAGESIVVTGVPCAMTATPGKATGTGEVPSDAPGPTRWRFYLPVSICPEGSIKDRDIATDEDGSRHQVTAAVWTAIGYRVEAIRLEN